MALKADLHLHHICLESIRFVFTQIQPNGHSWLVKKWWVINLNNDSFKWLIRKSILNFMSALRQITKKLHRKKSWQNYNFGCDNSWIKSPKFKKNKIINDFVKKDFVPLQSKSAKQFGSVHWTPMIRGLNSDQPTKNSDKKFSIKKNFRTKKLFKRTIFLKKCPTKTNFKQKF